MDDTNTTSPAAQPILASTLLSREKSQQPDKHIWHTGIRSLDKPESGSGSLPSDLWSGGKIIGVIDDNDIDDTENTQELPWPEKVPLITQLIITHLASVYQNNNNTSESDSSPQSPRPPAEAAAETTVYIITPPTTTTTTSSALSPSTLATALQSTHPNLPTEDLLDSISLLQYLDVAGLADAVAEVLDTLSKPSTQTPTTTTTSISTPKSPVILILDGIIPTLLRKAAFISSATAVATNAVMVPLFRSLGLLVRRRGDVLVLMTLDTNSGSESELDLMGCFFVSGDGEAGGGVGASAFESHNESVQKRRKGKKRGGGFTVRDRGKGDEVMNVLASVIDEVVLVHRVDAKSIVEVLMDREGGAMGSWGVT